MIKSIGKLLAYTLLIFAWAWVMFIRVPVLLTHGTSVALLLAVTCVALCVGVPAIIIDRKIRAYIKEVPK